MIPQDDGRPPPLRLASNPCTASRRRSQPRSPRPGTTSGFRYLTRRSGDDAALRTVIEADPGFAVARAVAALYAAIGGDADFDAGAELAAGSGRPYR